MNPKKQSGTRRNHFYPNCGCQSDSDCAPCPHCGMCIVNAESCACASLPLGTDESLRYDPHREILGG